MTTTKNNEHNKLNVPNKREQNQTCLDSAEREGLRPKGNVPNLRFPEFQGEWEKCKLGDKCDLLCGYAFDGKNIVEQGTYLLMRGINITEGIIRHSSELDRYYTGSVNNLAKYKLTTGDLVIGMDGSKVGRNSAIVSLTENGSYLVQRVCRIKSCIGNDFLLQLVNNHKFHKYVDMVKTSSAIPHISLKDIQNFPIAVPSIQKEADKISRLFHLLDERITTQNKVIEDLKKLKSAISENLFKDVKGNIVMLSEICEIIKGKQINGEFLSEKGKYYVMNGGTEPSGYYSDYNVEANTISISEGGNSCGYVQFNTSPFWSGGHCYTIQKIADDVDNLYLYHYLKSQEKAIMKLRIGSGLPNIQKKDLAMFKIKTPTVEQQRTISTFLSSLDRKAEIEEMLLNAMKKEKQYLLRQMFI